MAVLDTLVRNARPWRQIAAPKTLTPSRHLPLSPLYHGSSSPTWSKYSIGLNKQKLRFMAASSRSYSILAAAGVPETAHANADGQVAAEPLATSIVNKGLIKHKDLIKHKIIKYDSELQRTIEAESAITGLKSMGVTIYGLRRKDRVMSWDNFAGYDQQKRQIEDTILLAPDSLKVYDDIARGTRVKFDESNVPKAVLFEGPPGTGKETCARIIANQTGVPLLYVPLRESQFSLRKVFSLANKLPRGAIVFLDTVDAFPIASDGKIHRILLRQTDRFEPEKKVLVIAATNRQEDLGPTLISCFDTIISFGLPNLQDRFQIVAHYAKQLPPYELLKLAQVTEKMSGGDIRNVCQQVERSWALRLLQLIRAQEINNAEGQSLPPLDEYIKSILNPSDGRCLGLFNVDELF